VWNVAATALLQRDELNQASGSMSEEARRSSLESLLVGFARPILQKSHATACGGDMAIEPKLPTGYYVYTISVADGVRYIGKGKGLQQNLTRAVLSGAKVTELVLVDNLTETEAYKMEYEKLREYVFAGKRHQLWNVIPASIQTPQELRAFTELLSAI
jgi:hypothetical protein